MQRERSQTAAAERVMQDTVLQVRDLQTHFVNDRGTTRAVDGVSFDVARGEILGIVGESGCGKSVTSLSIMGLIAGPQGRIAKGSIRFNDQELVGLAPEQLRRLRGRDLAMVFQDPMSSLNPYLRIGEQLTEGLLVHRSLSSSEAQQRAAEMLQRVGIADATQRLRDYPHELSGGMRQRVMLAMALLCDPQLLILDEPTTALDVTVQAQILELLLGLRAERQVSAIFITHDLGVVAQVCDRVLVMYAGRVVEQASTAALFGAPSHPYTRALIQSLPNLNRRSRLKTIEGLPPRLDQGKFNACTFLPRCALAHERCAEREPELRSVHTAHESRCVLLPGEMVDDVAD
jgi:oligopeptide/dipeptide ABC transporter ATP-binding protein